MNYVTNLTLFRMDGVALGATFCESVSKSGGLDGARRLALRHIESFIQAFSDQQALATASSTWAPAALMAVADAARIQEAGHLRCRYKLHLQCIICILDDVSVVSAFDS